MQKFQAREFPSTGDEASQTIQANRKIFTEQPELHSGDIHVIASQIAQNIYTKEAVILDQLRDDMDSAAKRVYVVRPFEVGSDLEKDADVRNALERIRSAIAEELNTLLPDISLHVVFRNLTPNRRVGETNQGNIVKITREDNAIAMNRLYSLIDRDEHLLYPVLQHSSDWSVQVQKKIHFFTLDHFLRQDPLPPLSQTLSIVRDVIHGAHFLSDHLLNLSDIVVRNIGILPDTNAGVFFDYDELSVAESSDIAAEQMIGEFGHVLRYVADTYSRSCEEAREKTTLQKLHSLAHMYTSTNGSYTLASVIDELSTLILQSRE